MHIDEILELRRAMPAYDEELWTFMDQTASRNLENISGADLQARLEQIDKNILYIDTGSTPRDDLPADHGWLSPWWWLRARHWTLLEFERRQLAPSPSPEIPAMPTLARGFDGTVAGGQKLLVRLSERRWLLDLLGGRMRFVPAARYRDIPVDTARSDEEMSKAYRRPGQSIQITGSQGNTIKAIGDVVFASRRCVERNGVLDDVPYWLCSFSSDLDPRLFHEFRSDACIVIFDPMEFVRRALPHLNREAPNAVKSLFPNDYFDQYFLSNHKLRAMVSKEMAFAYQREMRFALDPEGGPALANGDLFVDIGSLEDIAAVYTSSGQRVSGIGPDSFIA